MFHQPHQVRVLKESEDLLMQLAKLRAFIHGPKFTDVDKDERARLTDQCAVMEQYAKILAERMAAWKD